MTQLTPTPERDQNDAGESGSLADELKQESDKLRHLAEQLKAREEALSEMTANYPHFRQFVYAKVREEFERTLEELPDKDLETLAKEEGAQPLEAFIAELEQPTEGS
jgi:hypothetical protein